MDMLTIALIVAVIVFIIAWAVALNGEAKMRLTAESAIMRNSELNEQLKDEKATVAKRDKALESCEATINELESNLDVERKLAKNRLELSNTYSNKIEELEELRKKEVQAVASERDKYRSLAEEGERTIQAQAKNIETLERYKELGQDLNKWMNENCDVCNGCGKPLTMKNWNVADGCPCNSPRGINHGLVPMLTCTCKECDPDQTGGTRQAETLIKQIVELTENDANGEVGRDPKTKQFVSKKKAS